MMHFLQNCLNPTAILMLFVAASCLAGYAFPGYKSQSSFLWLLWLAVGILALVSWIMLVAS
jgi:hypothetical protein